MESETRSEQYRVAKMNEQLELENGVPTTHRHRQQLFSASLLTPSVEIARIC
jgi:hypothetical protein